MRRRVHAQEFVVAWKDTNTEEDEEDEEGGVIYAWGEQSTNRSSS